MTANDKRIAEANECVKRATDALKTSLLKLKLKPDYDVAAVEYDRAAVCWKNAGDVAKAREMTVKAAEFHELSANRFHCAKSLEQAALFSRELGDGAAAVSYMERAAEAYIESGSLDTAAMALDKLAKQLESDDPDQAITVYEKALNLVQQMDRSRMASEFLNRLTRLFLNAERYSDAAKTIATEIERYVEVQEHSKVAQLTLALVVVQLMANGDCVAAEKSIQNALRCPGVDGTEDVRVGVGLIAAFESGDDDTLQAYLQHPTLKAMDNQYLRVMKKMKLAKSAGRKGDAEHGDHEEGDDEDDDLK